MVPWKITRLAVTLRYCLVISALAVIGCQPVPRPFEGIPPPDPALLRLDDRGGVVVLPIADAPPAVAEGLALAIAAGLRAKNVPAVTRGGNRESAFLQGRIDDPGHDAAIVWELFAGDASLIGAYRQPIEGTALVDWAVGESRLMAALAQASVGPIIVLMQGDLPPESALPRIILTQVTGAPGDGNESLALAMRTALAGSVELLNTGTAAMRLEGKVRLGQAVKERQSVEISWVVRDSTGQELGLVSQSNSVAAGSLDSQWRGIAVTAAEWAAVGILELLDEVQLRRRTAQRLRVVR